MHTSIRLVGKCHYKMATALWSIGLIATCCSTYSQVTLLPGSQQCAEGHPLHTCTLQHCTPRKHICSLKPSLSVPNFVSQLWRKMLRDKIRNGKPGFEASIYVHPLSSLLSSFSQPIAFVQSFSLSFPALETNLFSQVCTFRHFNFLSSFGSDIASHWRSKCDGSKLTQEA